MKKVLLRSMLLLVFLILAAFVSKKIYFWSTDGFSIANISCQTKNNPDWDVKALNADEKSEVDKALNQSYHYLAKGHQAYVFESEDKQYVIKFVKCQRHRHHPLIEMLPLPHNLETVRTKKSKRKEERQNLLFTAWKIAVDDLKEHTAVLHVHINKTQNQYGQLKLYNKIGVPYTLDLDQYVFMIQRKAESFASTIENQMAKGDVAPAKQLLDGLLDMYVAEFKKGFIENDRYIVRNTGVINNKPIQTDTGKLKRDDRNLDPIGFQKELQWKTGLLVAWLKVKYPELATHFIEGLEKITYSKENKE